MFSRPKTPMQYFPFDVAALASYHAERSAAETRKRACYLSWPNARGGSPPQDIVFFERQHNLCRRLRNAHTLGPIRRFGIS